METTSPEYAPFTAAAVAAGLAVEVDFGADCLWAYTPDPAGGPADGANQYAVGTPEAMAALTGEDNGWEVWPYDADGNPIGDNALYIGPDAEAALAAWTAAVTA